jgi:hypothetical protein
VPSSDIRIKNPKTPKFVETNKEKAPNFGKWQGYKNQNPKHTQVCRNGEEKQNQEEEEGMRKWVIYLPIYKT